MARTVPNTCKAPPANLICLAFPADPSGLSTKRRLRGVLHRPKGLTHAPPKKSGLGGSRVGRVGLHCCLWPVELQAEQLVQPSTCGHHARLYKAGVEAGPCAHLRRNDVAVNVLQLNEANYSISLSLSLSLPLSLTPPQYVFSSRHREHPKENSSPGGGCGQPSGHGVPAGSALPCGAAGQGGSVFEDIALCIWPNMS